MAERDSRVMVKARDWYAPVLDWVLRNRPVALTFAVLAGMFLAGRMVGPIQALRAGADSIDVTGTATPLSRG